MALFSIATCGTILLSGWFTSRPGFSTPLRASDESAITNSFGIYLLAEPVESSSVFTNLSELKLKSPPLISDSDIIAVYPTHEIIHVRPGVTKRLPGPTPKGTHFVAVADGEPLFVGTFWTSTSSRTPDTSAIIYVDSGPDYLSYGSFCPPAGSPVGLLPPPSLPMINTRAETHNTSIATTGWEYTGDPWSDPPVKSCLGKLHKLRPVEPL